MRACVRGQLVNDRVMHRRRRHNNTYVHYLKVDAGGQMLKITCPRASERATSPHAPQQSSASGYYGDGAQTLSPWENEMT